MTEVILTALISGLCVAIPSVIATMSSNSKHSALVDYRIEQLDKKVEKHNNIVERTYILEQEHKNIKERLDRYFGS